MGSDSATCINPGGSGFDFFYAPVNDEYTAVRPALYLDLDADR